MICFLWWWLYWKKNIILIEKCDTLTENIYSRNVFWNWIFSHCRFIHFFNTWLNFKKYSLHVDEKHSLYPCVSNLRVNFCIAKIVKTIFFKKSCFKQINIFEDYLLLSRDLIFGTKTSKINIVVLFILFSSMICLSNALNSDLKVKLRNKI